MPTNDERREMAAKLRGLAVVALRGSDDVVGFIEALDEELFDFGPNLMSDIALRLADLIEPEERTCRVVTEVRAVSLTQDMHTKSCSACGYVFGSEVHTQLLPGLGERVAVDPVVIPNYCPNCGARVVHDA